MVIIDDATGNQYHQGNVRRLIESNSPTIIIMQSPHDLSPDLRDSILSRTEVAFFGKSQEIVVEMDLNYKLREAVMGLECKPNQFSEFAAISRDSERAQRIRVMRPIVKLTERPVAVMDQGEAM